MVDHNGTPGNDTIVGGATNDVMNGLGGNDVLTGFGDGDILDGGAGNDSLDGGAMNDVLKGGSGNDTLIGGIGEDTMTGGAGNDLYAVDDLDDQVIELAGGGTDSILAEVGNVSLVDYDNVEILSLTALAGATNASGSDRSDSLNGNTFINTLTGGIGNDTLDGGGSDDVMEGELGNDFYYVGSAGDQVIEAAGEGKDTVFANVDYKLAAGQEIEVLSLQGIAGLSGTGNEFANTIIGNVGDNILDGGKGNDTLTGGKGNDIYVVDSAADKVTESAGQGIDSVFSLLASYTLGANVENLFLVTGALDGTGNALNNNMDGNSLGNTLDGGGGHDDLTGGGGGDSLIGGAGNDTLDGGSGADTMTGGAGNDTYQVNELTDSVVEAAGGGVDLVKTNVDGLVLGANVENLTLQGAAIHGAGNTLANYITGNGIGNSLAGQDGNDTLDGAGGADNLSGGKGNDTYFVDDLNDKVSESAGQGKDTVFASADFTLGTDQEVEIITLTGGIDLEATGNNLANTINGDSGDNALDGLGANDTLNGNVGNDILDGGTGDDVMNGGKDSDTYYVDSSKDKITEAAGQGTDQVFSKASSFTLGANIENGLMMIGAGNLTGNALNNSIDGNSVGNLLDGGGGNDDLEGHDGVDTLLGGAGNDTLDGGIGDDKMTGGAGNDTYEVDSFSDVINELAGGSIDTMRTGLSGFLLAAQVENLVLTGSADISGSGNSLANFLTGNGGKNTLMGNAGNDTLDGGAVNDTLIGGAGNDTYYVDHLGDKVQESAGGGKDTVISSVSFSFTDSEEIETVILTASGGTGSVGNNFANTITMTGTGTATINGNDGNDTLTGGSGIDLILGGNGNDVINGGGGNDSLFGDANDDKLNGGEGDDALNGGTGKDAMVGGKGSDFYAVSEVGDTVTELAGQGTDTVQSNLGSYTLAANVERLMLSTGAVNGTGNTLDNLIFGNLADNKLDGGGGADIISGGDGNDNILGGLGFDYLSGGSGNDTLKGGSDVDYLEGGSGKDVMYGEAGKDGFLYRIEDPGDLATLGGDTINGFQTNVDRIELTDLLDEFGISAANAFSGGFVLLTKDGSNTLVQFDQNGGANSLITLATVANANVAAGDLMLDSQFIL